MHPGLFGKLPAHGDFICRDVSAPLRRALDHWITRYIGQQALPAGGLRARLTLGGTSIFAVIMTSRDKRGRIFPIVALARDTGQDMALVDEWCDLVAEMLGEGISDATEADTLVQTLPPPPHETTGDPQRADALWRQGETPQPLAHALASFSSD
ncbi:type VI secretion system-associated protein TagF [Yoonia sp. F2084L]|uniref:TagF domain-containing protein n=1 Tax=Yoonia sp. F2084L TaxID=2926419 RepID=UPI001FF40576|nr:TagF domain-containing protein [Yoonia sp. F2084L]MCK0094134.1 type VI secretion system-associated protein TagF [Yoonia sp. F2084L]